MVCFLVLVFRLMLVGWWFLCWIWLVMVVVVLWELVWVLLLIRVVLLWLRGVMLF